MYVCVCISVTDVETTSSFVLLPHKRTQRVEQRRQHHSCGALPINCCCRSAGQGPARQHRPLVGGEEEGQALQDSERDGVLYVWICAYTCIRPDQRSSIFTLASPPRSHRLEQQLPPQRLQGPRAAVDEAHQDGGAEGEGGRRQWLLLGLLVPALGLIMGVSGRRRVEKERVEACFVLCMCVYVLG